MKKIKLIKKSICMLLIMLMAFSLASCGKKVDTAETLKTLYKESDFVLNTELSYITNTFSKNDLIYVIGGLNKSSNGMDINDPKFYENGGYIITTNYIKIFDLDGNLKKSVELFESDYNSKSNTSLNCACMNVEGNIYLGLSKSSYTKEDQSDYKTENVMEIYDKDGNKISSNTYGTEEDGYYSFVCGKDGKTYATSGNTVACIDKEGKKLYEIKLSDNDWINNIASDRNGQVYASVFKMVGEKYEGALLPIDDTKKDFGTKVELPSGLDEYSTFITGNENVDFLVNKDGSLFTFDIETKELKEIINWTASGYNSDNIGSICMLTDGSVITNLYNVDDDSVKSIRLVPVDPSEVKDKKIIKLYCWGLDYDIKNYIIEYNKKSEDSIIVVTDYNQYNDNNSEDGYLLGSTKLNNDIVAGNIPDLLMVNYNMPVNSYASKGLFVDLYEKMSKDDDIDINDYIPNIIDAMKINGKLYTITKSFTISALIGKTEFVGEEAGWTMDDMQSAVAKLGENGQLFNYPVTKSDFLNTAVLMSGNEYVDWNKGTCSFDSDGFVKLLEYCNTLPQEIDYDSIDYDWNDMQTWFRDNKALIQNSGVYSYNDVRENEALFGGPISFKGFPCDGKATPLLNFSASSLAVMSKGTNQDGAWDFIKYYLTNNTENEDKYGIWGFSIKKSVNELSADKYLHPDNYKDENGNPMVYSSSTYWIGGKEVKLPEPSQKDVDKINNVINTVNGTTYYDQTITDIITEESGAFFAGQKTSDEVAKLIQDRVNIYINESR